MVLNHFLVIHLAQSLSPLAETQTEASQNNLNLETNGFDTFSLEILTQITQQVIRQINFFSLAFSIFSIFIFLAGFFQHRLVNSRKGKGQIEKKAVKCLNRSLSASKRQILIILVFLFWSAFKFGIFNIILDLLVIILFMIKLRFDFVEILEDLKYFDWLENFRLKMLKSLGKK
jgi:hypothetical protein